MESSMDFSKFSVRDREALKTFAHRRSRKVLRTLSYPEEKSEKKRAAAKAKMSDKPEAPKAAVALTLSPLEFALGPAAPWSSKDTSFQEAWKEFKGPEAEAARNFINDARRPLAEDACTAICNDGASLD